MYSRDHSELATRSGTDISSRADVYPCARLPRGRTVLHVAFVTLPLFFSFFQLSTHQALNDAERVFALFCPLQSVHILQTSGHKRSDRAHAGTREAASAAQQASSQVPRPPQGRG